MATEHRTDKVPADPAADPLLREALAAELLGGLSVKTLQAWRVSGNGPRYVKLGSGLRAAVRYRRSELLRFLADCECNSTAEHAVKGAK